MTAEIETMAAEIKQLKRKIYLSNRKSIYLEKMYNELCEEKKSKSLKIGVTTAIKDFISRYYSRYSSNCLSREIADGVWKTDLLEGVARMHLIKAVRTYFNEYVYTPLNFLEAMDMDGGKCNIQALMLLQDIEININHLYKTCTNV